MASKKAADKSKNDPFASFDDVLSKGKGGKGAAAAAAADAPASDPIAGLEGVARGSRPQTPRPSSSKKTPAAAATPGRTSTEEQARKVEDDKKAEASGGETASAPAAAAAAPASNEKAADGGAADTEATEASEAAAGGGGGWWGGLGGFMGAASAAVRQAQSQAELLAKELQKNEEAQKWAEHVKGNAALLRSYGGDLRQITGELRSRALPGLTNLLHTLAPPISSHERLQVHITHDMTGYPSLDPLVHAVFTRVMAQVEGGDLLVLQRGSGGGPKTPGDKLPTPAGASAAGWSDGPWWRDLTQRRDIGPVAGLVEGSKLARASAEAFADEHFARTGNTVEEARARADDAAASESNPTRSSDIFLAVQAVTRPRPAELFGGGKTEDKAKEGESAAAAAEADDADDEEELLFAVYLHDPLHGLAYGAATQPLPARWVTGWLDLPASAVAEHARSPELGTAYLPPDIAELVVAGGLDPREWAAEWVEEALALAVGVVAQRYVARRMGVGLAAGLSGTAAAADVRAAAAKSEDVGAGELARAM